MVIFDVVIPVGPKDKDKITKQLTYTKRNIVGYRKIFIITDLTFNPPLDGVVIIPEHFFPFNKTHINTERSGWYLQQLFKIYAWKACPNILPQYLVIDCDTFFLKKTIFWENNIPLYNYGSEYHQPYFEHISRLIPTIQRQGNKSGITHHMMFEKHYLEELFSMVDGLFWERFLSVIDDSENSGASEYELYFHFMNQYYPQNIKIRELSWENGGSLNSELDYVSHHWYL